MHNHSSRSNADGDCPENPTVSQNLFSLSLSVPGKVILFGEHSVVYGKLAIAASLGLRTKFSFREYEPNENGGDKVYINLKSINSMCSYNFSDLQILLKNIDPSLLKDVTLEEPETANHEQLRAPIDEFIKKNDSSISLSPAQYNALYSLFYLLIVMVGSSNIDIKPFQLDIETDVTISAGLGSSASLMVGICAVFFRYIQCKSFKKDRKENLAKDFSKRDLNLISRWAYSAEKIIHGTPSGLDNTICTFGSVVEYRKNSSMKVMEMHYKLKVLLINSNVPKDTKALVEKVAALRRKYPTVVDNILVAMDNISHTAVQELINLDAMYTSEKLTIEERDYKVDDIYNRLQDLVDFNQNLLRSLQVSHPSLEKICAILAEAGLHGKITGAGGGGYAFAIIPPTFNKNIFDIIETLNSHGFDAKLTDLGGPGLTFT